MRTEKIPESILVAERILFTEWTSEEMPKNRTAALDGLDGADIDHTGTNFLGKLAETDRNHHGPGFDFRYALGLKLIFKTVPPPDESG
jgi:hypothetical protein